MHEPEGFADFVARRSAALVRSAWVLTGNEATAHDLVQTALVKTWARWDDVHDREAPEAYVRRVVVTTFLSWRRRRWRGEVPVASLPDRPDRGDAFADADVRALVRAALMSLTARQRAVVMLRYFDGLTESETAAAMGCSVGTVKSQTARTLAKLRSSPLLRDCWQEDVIDELH